MDCNGIAVAADAPLIVVAHGRSVDPRELCQALPPEYRIVAVAGGIGALTACHGDRPDLVLLDMTLPDMDSLEVCRSLKSDPATQAIPIIFLTTCDDPEQDLRGLRSGAADFIAWPSNPAVAGARIRTHLDLHRTARRLMQLNESLESRILARTCELEGAMQSAETAHQAKSRFLSNMSHEIRTPIHGVLGMAGLALSAEPPPAPAQRAFLEKIQSSGRQLLALVSDILDFSQIEAGQFHLQDIDFDLMDACKRVADQALGAARAKGLGLVFEIDPALEGTWRGDPARIAQVLGSYVGNAIKFSEFGEVHVGIRRCSDSGALDEIRFEVRDEGIGIAEAEMERLFRPFQQADASMTRRHGGGGLGLALCKQLAVLMGGDVGVSSRAGEGSLFWCTVRLLQVAGASCPLAGGAPSIKAAWGHEALHGARLLVAEDNLINQELVRCLLEDVGAVVDVVGDGRQAVAASRAACYDCILMDLQMPVMDGLEAARQIRAHPATAATPMLALSANNGREEHRQAAEAGMDDFIEKPLAPELLYAALDRWIRRPAEMPPAVDSPAGVQEDGSPRILDPRVLSTNVGGDPGMFRRFARLFIDAVPQAVADVERALAGGDASTLADLGHRLKTSALTVGALALADLCKALETMRHDTALAQARALAERIPEALRRAAAELGKEIR